MSKFENTFLSIVEVQELSNLCDNIEKTREEIQNDLQNLSRIYESMSKTCSNIQKTCDNLERTGLIEKDQIDKVQEKIHNVKQISENTKEIVGAIF